MNDRKKTPKNQLLAHWRYQVIGHLLACPPHRGELRTALIEASKRTWTHPVTGAPKKVSVSTLERWLYAARKQRHDPVSILQRKVRSDLGAQTAMNAAVRKALSDQYIKYKHWSVQLHYLNLRALAETTPELGDPLPSYSTVRRFFRAQGFHRRRILSSNRTEGVERAEERLDNFEVRSWEVEHVNSLWHWDGHKPDFQVLTPRGEYERPILIGVIDDHSRLACHFQWFYGAERAQIVAHTLSQAIQKRGRPRLGYHDNGSAMIAEEVQEGMKRLGIVDARTLPRSAYMNGKAEAIWQPVENQLMAMLAKIPDLTLESLNEVTQAWCEYHYNREKHQATGEPPLTRFLNGHCVGLPSPSSEEIRLAFTRTERRMQRLSDGSTPIEGRRFEIPNQYRHLRDLLVRYAKWDLTYVYLVDEHTGEVLCRLYPQDKVANSSGVRRPLQPVAVRRPLPLLATPDLPPLLSKLLREQAATGLAAPPYLPLDDDISDEDESRKDSK